MTPENSTIPYPVRNPQKFMTMIYVVSLSVIAVLSIIAHLVLDSVIAQQSQTATLVNVSGQQRMLSQRTALFTMEYLATGSAEAKQLAADSLRRMQDNFTFLTRDAIGGRDDGDTEESLSATLQRMYFAEPINVDAKLARFALSVENVLDTPPEEFDAFLSFSSDFMQMARGPFLKDLNDVVSQYETESHDKIQALRDAQNVVLAIIIFTILVEALFVFRPMVSKISDFARKLQFEANYDHLSGIYNRRAFYQISEKLFYSFQRYKQSPCSVILLDIDRFKPINDTYGHDAGDMVIQHIAELLSNTVRKSDVLARFGGEEFVIFLPETQLHNAVIAAEKIRTLIEQSRVEFQDEQIKYTISAGVSECRLNDHNLDNAIKRADNKLYIAKHSGRNKVCADAVKSPEEEREEALT